jgi:hypothetical protein
MRRFASGIWPPLVTIAFAAAFAVTVLASGSDPHRVATALGDDATPVPTWTSARFGSAAPLPPLRSERRVERRAAAVRVEPTPTPAPIRSPAPQPVVAPSPEPFVTPPAAEQAPSPTVAPAPTTAPPPPAAVPIQTPAPTPAPSPTFDSSGLFDSSG